MNNKHDEYQRWENAIEEADTWSDPSLPHGPKKKRGELKELAKMFDLLGSNKLPTFVNKLLADLFERHRLVAISNRTPRYRFSKAEMEEQKYLDATLDYKQQNWPHGPITKIEMEMVGKELKARRHVDLKAAARQRRQERLRSFCNERGLDCDKFEKVLSGRVGSINRRWNSKV